MNNFSAFNDIPAHLIGVFIIAVIIGVIIGITIMVFYLLNLQNALKQCAPQNRTMEPGMVWLCFIPFFNYYWNFRIASDISTSLANEYRARGMKPSEERPGYQIGMAYAILTCCGILSWVGVPVLPELAGLAGFVCWIIFWVRIAKYKNELMQSTQFAFGNPNPYPFPNQFPGQPQHPNTPPSPYDNPNAPHNPNQP